MVNRYLDAQSVIFIDELELTLHPSAVIKFLDIISLLAESGIKFFIGSNSYFVIKKLYIIALKNNISIPLISVSDNNWVISDLKKEMPDNSIVNESIKLF